MQIIFLFKKINKLNGQNIRSKRIAENTNNNLLYINQISFKILFKKYDLIYIENSTFPFFLSANPYRSLIIAIFMFKNRKKIHLFYRDVHWKFNMKKNSGRFKTLVLYIFFQIELLFFKCSAYKYYLPSLKMNNFVEFKNFNEFHPRCSKFKNNRSYSSQITLAYSGNINEAQYDIHKLINNAINNKIYLDIYCPKSSFQNNPKYADYHMSEYIKFIFDEDFYYSDKNYSYFLDTRNKNDYLDFSMPLKIFDAISKNIPIITSNPDTEYSNYIINNNLGFACNDIEGCFDILKSKPKDLQDFQKHVDINSWEIFFKSL